MSSYHMNRRTSTAATRRYRDNDRNRERENRARVMSRIGEGSRPRRATLQRYNILPAEVDAAREAVGLDALYEDNNYQSTTVLQNINRATQKEIDEVARQQRLIVELEEDQEKLRELQLDAEEENAGRVMRVPAARLYNVHVIKQFLWKNDPFKKSDKTKAVAYGPKPTPENQNARAGQLYQTFRKYFEAKGVKDFSWENNIEPALRDMVGLTEAAAERKTSSTKKLTPASLVTPLRQLSVMMDLYPTGRSLAKQLPTEYAILQQLKTERELKSQAYIETKKQQDELPFDWNEVEDIVTGKFGYLSKQDMYIKFFSENPSRDDLGNLIINPERASGNYIRIQGNDVTFYLNDYKTKRQYGPIKNKLSRGLAAQVKEYIRINGLNDGDALFGTGRMSEFVSKLVTDAGVRVAGQRGGINLLRRIYVSTRVRAGLTENERYELALALKHSPLASIKYVRQFRDKTDDAAAAGELPRTYA